MDAAYFKICPSDRARRTPIRRLYYQEAMAEHKNESPDQELEKYRPYLILLARMNLGQELQGKLDASDLVQHTLLEAYRKRDQFRGQGEAEMAAWLRQMLVYALADVRREFKRGKRCIARERSLQATLDGSSVQLEGLAAQQSSPSQRTVRHENILRLAAALLQLPEDQRQAVERKHLQGLSVAEIAVLLNRSETAVGGLLRRGMTSLGELLKEKDESDEK
jgi:RNA polymerase sigma-70 factor (ECF subfamily)